MARREELGRRKMEGKGGLEGTREGRSEGGWKSEGKGKKGINRRSKF